MIDDLSRRQKRQILVTIDVALFALALWTTYAIRLSTLTPDFSGNYLVLFLIMLGVRIPAFGMVGMYRFVLRHPNNQVVAVTLKGVLISTLAFGAAVFLMRLQDVPRSILLIEPFVATTLVISSREVLAWLVRSRSLSGARMEPVLIYGAGSAGLQLAQSLRYNTEMSPAAFLDDEPSKWGMRMAELAVYPPARIPRLVSKYGIKKALLAAPASDAAHRRQMIDMLEKAGLTILEVPNFLDLVRGGQSLADLSEVKADDLLGRRAVLPDKNLLREVIPGRTVLITGAGGSIGSELCRQVAALGPSQLVLFEISEFALYTIEMQLGELYPELKVAAVLGSVLDEDRLEETYRRFNVESVYHAAAYKHVPLVEQNPIEGVRNNVVGTLNAARAAARAGVSSFLFVSTDKAVRPCNVMGASKRMAELAVLLVAEEGKRSRPQAQGKNDSTRFTIVRFGNVLDSAGSVVPLFRRQIASGGPVTVTDPDVQRYFMTIPEAAQLVVQASAMGSNGEVYLLDMGEPIRVHDLAKRMVDFATRGSGREIPIAFTGLRPGEKLIEELLVDPRNSEATSHPKIFKASEEGPDHETVARLIQKLNKALDTDALPAVYGILEELVEGYGRPEASQDVLGRCDCSYSFAANHEDADGETSEPAQGKRMPGSPSSRCVS
ncbi:MAG: nucleoside-diphosphate sugar epimerase/dehydratase [Planctomycetota bacterium]|jgi:FlaA1/EpsC-like NDP-sugar epimerase|nr:nucleoside-diphosphate sugar epimerase/dehydratase [Planctomycetota bacterium]